WFCPVPLDFPANPAGTPLLVGSGPYFIANYVPDQRIVLKRNPYYHGTRPHHADLVVVDLGGSIADAIAAVAAAQLDYAYLEASAADTLLNRNGVGSGQVRLVPFD